MMTFAVADSLAWSAANHAAKSREGVSGTRLRIPRQKIELS